MNYRVFKNNTLKIKIQIFKLKKIEKIKIL